MTNDRGKNGRSVAACLGISVTIGHYGLPRPSAIGHWSSAIGHRPLVIRHWSSAISHQPSTIGHFRSLLCDQLAQGIRVAWWNHERNLHAWVRHALMMGA